MKDSQNRAKNTQCSTQPTPKEKGTPIVQDKSGKGKNNAHPQALAANKEVASKSNKPTNKPNKPAATTSSSKPVAKPNKPTDKTTDSREDILEKAMRNACRPLLNPAFLTSKECRDVAKLDAATLCNTATDCDKFVAKNYVTYHVLIHTWLYQVAEIDAACSYMMLDIMRVEGLIPLINECQTVASALIRANDSQPVEFVRLNNPVTVMSRYHCLHTLVANAPTLSKALQVLRYPKRFSPLGATRIADKTLKAFEEINEHDRGSYHWNTLIPYIRDEVTSMIRTFSVDERDSYFSSGATLDGGKTLVNKLKAMAKIDHNVWGIPLELPGCPNSPYFEPTVKFKVVPKSYKIGRGIAMETARNQFHLQAIREGLVKALRNSGSLKYFDPSDQSISQSLALHSSHYGDGYASIDLSSASDSIPEELAAEVFQGVPSFWNVLRPLIPMYYVLDSKELGVDDAKLLRFGDPRCGRGSDISVGYGVDPVVRRLHDYHSKRLLNIFLTSGNAVTFNAEAILFLAICRTARKLYMSLCPGEEVLEPHVYGDDILVDNKTYTLTIDMLEVLGMLPNVDKSYGPESAYREACGAEGVFGRHTDSRYFPRTSLDWGNGLADTLAALTSLQHRLFACKKAEAYLTALVRSIYPDMTSHQVGTECADLWSSVPQFFVRCAPYKGTNDDVAAIKKMAGSKRLYTWAQATSELTNTAYLREGHACLSIKYDKTAPISVGDQLIVDAWHYAKFLNIGPAYEDDLSRALHISMKVDSRTDFQIGDATWGITAE